MEEGREQGLRLSQQLVSHLIEKRFGPMPEKFEKKLLSMTMPELDDLAVRVLDAKSTSELFAVKRPKKSRV